MYKEVAIMWKNKESYVDYGGVFGLSIIKHVTLQKSVAHDFRYDPRMLHIYAECTGTHIFKENLRFRYFPNANTITYTLIYNVLVSMTNSIVYILIATRITGFYVN